MHRFPLSAAVLTLSLFSVGFVPQSAAAAPLPAAYAAAAGGDLARIDLDVQTGTDLTAVQLAVSEATMNGGVSPTSTAAASNVAAGANGSGIQVNSNSQVAPPDHPNPTSGSLGASSGSGLAISALSTDIQARTEAAVACSPGGGIIAKSTVQSNGATLNRSGLGTVVDTGYSSTTGTVSIVPEPLNDPLNRAVLSSATGNISSSSFLFLDGDVQVAISGNPALQAFATGSPGGADVSYSPGTVTVTTASNPSGTVVALGASQTFNVPNGQVVITVNQPSGVTESSDGRMAAATVAVVTADITVGPGTAPLATATVKLLPLSVSATVPAGGIDCQPPAPVLNAPAAGSTITDTTPTFTGTAQPGAQVKIFIDGILIGTTTANGAGNFSFTPTTPLETGFHNYTAKQTTDGGTSPASNGNGFAILGPPVLETPADGSATNDTTPTFTGLTFPGAQVDIFVDGNPIGTATADGTGHFSFTPSTPLNIGDHQYRAKATLNGTTSGLSNPNDFTIDLTAPAAPTLNRPADGSVTRDRTPTFTGTAEAGADVEIFVDGNSIGSTTANGSGNFSFTPTTPLAPGPHEAFAGATDPAGNDSPQSNTNGFVIDTDDPAAPGITSPADGGNTTDRTPTITGSAEPGSQVIIYVDGEQVGSTTADENGKYTFTLPDGLSVGTHKVSAVAVDEAGNRSDQSDPVTFGVLAAEANAGGGQNQQLGQTGGVQGWLPITGALGVLAGAAVLAVARWRRRGSQA